MKRIISGVLLSMIISGTAMAETVVVNGSGINREAAINDAKRNAVEKVVGTYISSVTITNKSQVLKDEIYSKAYGFVNDIKIIEESQGAVCEVKASVSVDSSPNSELMNKLEMIKTLNDPRISVVIMHANTKFPSIKYINLCETIITEKLRELGFNKIIDKAKIWQKKNEGSGEIVISKGGGIKITTEGNNNKADIKGNDLKDTSNSKRATKEDQKKAEKKPDIPKPGPIDYEAYLPNSDTDVFIFGSLDYSISKVLHPTYSDLREERPSSFDTGFLKTTANLEIKLLKSDSMEQIGVHSLNASYIHSDINTAEREAIKSVAIQAAEKIADSFMHKSASLEKGFVLQACVEHENIDKLMVEIKKASGVRNVRFRNYGEGKALYEVEGDISAFELFKYLQNASRFRVTKLKVSDNLLEIIVV